MKTRKIVIGAFTLSALVFPLGASAWVIPNPVESVLGSFRQQFNTVSRQLESVKSSKLAEWGESVSNDLQLAMDEAMGALGFPDIIAVREGLERSQRPEDGGLYSETTLANAIDRSVTRVKVGATLSHEGQQQSIATLQQIAANVASVQDAAAVAQGERVTQNVMKQIARQNEHNADLLGSIVAAQVQQAQRDELTNANLANISESVDGQNLQKNAELMGAAMDLYRTSSMVGLY